MSEGLHVKRLVTSHTARVVAALCSLCLLLSACDLGPLAELAEPKASANDGDQGRSGDERQDRSGDEGGARDESADDPAPAPGDSAGNDQPALGDGGGNEPAPGDSDCDHTFSGDVSDADGFTVPAGETWCFDPHSTTVVEVSENVVVKGQLRMRPASAAIDHTLRFVGIDETRVVGGHTTVPLATDVGLWVMGDGVLDLQGTPRTGWNRTGTDPSWQAGDELVQAPIAPGDWKGFTEYRGGNVPSSAAPDGTSQRTEILNLTRNVHIEGGGSNPGEILSTDGRAHILIASTQPQTIKYAELRYLGPRAPHQRDGTDGAHGRYGLHFHRNGDGSRGTVVEGTVLRDNGSHGYVAHTSHGITFRDTVSYDTWETPYWWDPDAETHDLLYDHALAAYVKPYPAFRGYDISGFALGEGVNMTVRDSVAVGVGSRAVNAAGFMWPSKANGGNNLWTFDNNVAHNNRDAGIAVWQNDPHGHEIENSMVFNNGGAGITHGAYLNKHHFTDVDLWGNDDGIELHALSRSDGTRGIRFSGMFIDGVLITKHRLMSDRPVVFHNVMISGSVVVDESRGEAGIIRFESTTRRSDLSRSDFVVKTCRSKITVHNSDGSSFRVCS